MLFKKKDTSIPLEKYFKLVKPKYVYIKIIPDRSIRNYNSVNIAKAIKHTYKAINKRIRVEKRKLWVECNFKIAYIVDIKLNDIGFYFMVPEVFQGVIIEKINEIWNRATIEIIDKLEEHTKESLCYQLAYKKEDALSLDVDKKSNEPLNSILSVIGVMKDTDRVTIVYNFQPRNDFGWSNEYQETMKKIKENKSVLREKTDIKYIAITAITTILSFIDDAIKVISDFTAIEQNKIGLMEAAMTLFQEKKELSLETRKKKDLGVINCQMAVLSSSDDPTRKENNALAVAHSYRTLDADNELIAKKVKFDFRLQDYNYKNIDSNTFSTDECSNFLQLPGRTLLQEHKIKHIETNENPVPPQLQEGTKRLGNVKYKGSTCKSYLQNEYDIGNYPLVMIGSQKAGKSTFMGNNVKDCVEAGESVIVIDFIKNCELSETIKQYVPPEKLVEIDLAKEEFMQGLGYNEIVIEDNMTAFKKMELANLQAQQVINLVDAISLGDPLSGRMRRPLMAAANICFVQKKNSIKNVVECLENHVKRYEYIKNLPKILRDLMQDDINTLRELDEYSKATKEKESMIIGTKGSKIEYILDRICLLREDFKLKYMFNKNLDNNINLVECMDQGKVVLIKMKEGDFPTQMIKNILVTYLITKIWLSSQLRGMKHLKPSRCNVFIDELFQAPTSLEKLVYMLPQSRKMGTKFIFSTQCMNQLEKIFKTLEVSGASFMLLRGSLEDDFNHFKNKLTNYEYEDLKDMTKTYEYPSMNLIYYSEGYASFISQLPKPTWYKKSAL